MGDADRDEYLTMDYSRLCAPLCAAVGELRNQVAALSAHVHELESAPEKKRNGTAARQPL